MDYNWLKLSKAFQKRFGKIDSRCLCWKLQKDTSCNYCRGIDPQHRETVLWFIKNHNKFKK